MRSTSVATVSNSRLSTVPIVSQAFRLGRASITPCRCQPSPHTVLVTAAAAAGTDKAGSGKDNNDAEGDGAVPGFLKNAMREGLAAVGGGADTGLETDVSESVGQSDEMTAVASLVLPAVLRRNEVLPELLGPLYTAELQQCLASCKTPDQLFPVRAQEMITAEADAASILVITPRASANEPIAEAHMAFGRVLQGELYQGYLEAAWLADLQLHASTQLPGFVKHLMAAAAKLQHSSELAAAGSLPHNARLPQVLQRCAAAQVAHYITTADVLSMPRTDLPALVAALCAAEVCLGFIACTGEQGGYRANVEPAFQGMVEGMQPLVASSNSPWLHALHVWACSQRLSCSLVRNFAQRSDKSLSGWADWLNSPWSNDEAALVSAALKTFEYMQRVLESAVETRVTHHGGSVPLRTFLAHSAPLIMADISFNLLLYKAIQRKAQKWKGGAPKMEQQSVEVWMMYLGALKREYALYGAEGHRALFMYASSFFLVGMGGQSYEIYNRDLLTCPVVYGLYNVAGYLGGLSNQGAQHYSALLWHLVLFESENTVNNAGDLELMRMYRHKMEEVAQGPYGVQSHGHLGMASRRLELLTARGAATADVLASAAKQLWTQFRDSSHHLAAYHPCLLRSVASNVRKVLPSHSLLDLMEQQLSVSPTQLVRAAALVAATERDADAIHFLAQAVTAIQQNDLEYTADVETLACLSLALENQPFAALDRLLDATSSSSKSRAEEMQLFDLRSVLVDAMCKHPGGIDRLVESLALPGPALPAAMMQQALQALAANPERLPDAWAAAERVFRDRWEGSDAVVDTLWCAALNAGPHGELVVNSMVKAAACFPASSVARMLVATWQAEESCKVHHHQLVSVLVFQLVVNADLVGTAWFGGAAQALMPLPSQPPGPDYIVARLFNLVYEGWQGTQPCNIQPWAMEEVIPLLSGVSSVVADSKECSPVQMLGQQLVQSLLQGGHGQYVAEVYKRLVAGAGLELGSTEQAQLLQQAGPTKALPLLMSEVEDKGVRASDQGLLSVLLESASSGSSDSAVLSAAAHLLSSPSITARPGLCTSALQAAARSAGTAAHGALELATAAFTRAVNMQPSRQAASACISLATGDNIAAQWLEVVKESLTKATAAAAAPWYDALLMQASELAQQGGASALMSATSTLLTAAGSQRVKLELETLVRTVVLGLSGSAAGNAGAQVAVRAVRIVQQQHLLPKVLARLDPGQRQALSSALVDAKQWDLALTSSREPAVLSQILGAAAGQQLPASALTAALDAAVTAERPDLTLAFVEAHVLAGRDLNASALLTILGGPAGLVRLCKHLLLSASSAGQAKQPQGEQRAEPKQQHQQHVVVQLVERVVGGNSGSRRQSNSRSNRQPLDYSNWQVILDAMASAVAAKQLPVSGRPVAEDIIALCRLASSSTKCAAATWHLFAAAQLAAAPQSVSSALYCLEDLEALRKVDAIKEPGGNTEGVCLKLEFVAKVCSRPRALDTQLHSWVALFFQQAVEALGEDPAVKRVPKPAAVEVAMACMSQGQPRLVLLLHQAAKAQGGHNECMPPLRLMALQAAVATQQWEEAEKRLLPKVLQDIIDAPAYTRSALKAAKALSPESGPDMALLALDLKTAPSALSGPLAAMAMQRIWQDWAAESDIAVEAVDADRRVAEWAISNHSSSSNRSQTSQSVDAWLAAVAGANACALLALHNPLQAAQQLRHALQLLSGVCTTSAEGQEQVLVAHARVHAACGDWSGLVGMCVASVQPPTDATSCPATFSSLFSIAGLPASDVNPWVLQATGSRVIKAATAMGGNAPLEANLHVMLGALTSSVILTGIARQETAAAAVGQQQETEPKQQEQEQQISLPTVLKDPVALAALHALVTQWPEEETALEQVLGTDVLVQLAVAETVGDRSLNHIPQLAGVQLVDLTAWAQYIVNAAAASEGGEKDAAETSSTGRIGWGSMSPEARREVQRAALKELSRIRADECF